MQQDITELLQLYRIWQAEHIYVACRLVQYCGIECIGACDIPVTEIENRLINLWQEGFYVSWAIRDETLFLRVYEFGGPEPDWQKVFIEQHLAEIADIPEPLL